MKLTKREAIRRSTKQWTWCAETGKDKYDWPGLMEYDAMVSACALCEYGDRHNGCQSCPYYQKFGSCLDGPYWAWRGAMNSETKRKYAKLFLEQLKQL